MADCVVDTTVVALANSDLAAREPGNVFDQRLQVIEQVIAGDRILRYNSKLLSEYHQLVRQYHNDVIALLFAILDSPRAIFVRRSTLSRQHFEIATRKCRWPSHDQHLLAAAIGGNRPVIVVTEVKLAACKPRIYKWFAVDVHQV